MRRALDHMEDKSSLSLQDLAVCLGKPLKEGVLIKDYWKESSLSERRGKPG